MPNDRVLTSLAILTTNWDQQHRAYTDLFIPFLCEALHSISADTVDIAQAKTALEEEFGIALPHSIINTLLHRAAKLGLVTKEQRVFRVNLREIEKHLLFEARQTQQTKYSDLIAEFRKYAKENFSIELSDGQASDLIITLIQENSLALLKAVVTKDLSSLVLRNDDKQTVLISSFVVFLWENNKTLFDTLDSYIKGNALADAVYFPGFDNVAQRFRNVEVYFDTPFLLRALGYAPISLSQPCLELLELLFETGAELRCFEHTMQEIRGVLNASLESISRPAESIHGYFETTEWFRATGVTPSDIEFFIRDLADNLNSLRIKIKQKPQHKDSLTVDEEKLGSYIKALIPLGSRFARYRDIDSMTAIFRLRNGQAFERVESCRAVFVTSNSAVVKACRNYFGEEEYYIQVPLAYKDSHFTTLVWLKKPLRMPDLPRHRVIADSYAALNPSDRLWKKYIDTTESLRSQKRLAEEDYLLIRYTSEGRRAFIETTYGDDTYLSDEAIYKIVEKTRLSIVADVKHSLDTTQSELQIVRSQSQALEERIKELEERETRRAALERATNIREVSRSKIRAVKISRNVVNTLRILLVCAWLAGFYISLTGVKLSIEEILARPWKFILLGLYAVLGVIAIVRSDVLDQLYRKLETSLALILERLYSKSRKP